MSMKTNAMRCRLNKFGKTAAASVAVLAIVSCGGGDVSGPTNANIAGSWTYTMTNLAGGGLTCFSSGTTMTFSQSGATFTGTYSGGTLSCSAPGFGPVSQTIGNGTIATGTVNINSVSFDLDTSDWRNTGTVSGNSISGTVVVRFTSGSTSVILNGSFAAIKR
jgi:hypothetical protein